MLLSSHFSLFSLCILLNLLVDVHGGGSPVPNCAWKPGALDPKCRSREYTWNASYPECALFQYANYTPIPCQGQIDANYCKYEGRGARLTPPNPASWHIHVFFPNKLCTNCSKSLTELKPDRNFDGAMQLRQMIAQQLNQFTTEITGRKPNDPIDIYKASSDPSYNQCGDSYNIVAGAPANYQREPCIFEVDAVKELGPFTNPQTQKGYPNYSFFLPSEYWLPGLLAMFKKWLQAVRGQFGQYDVLIHPNTGCEVRDHMEEQSIEWIGRSYPLDAKIFSCRSLGCNQACPKATGAWFPPPANCSSSIIPEISREASLFAFV